MVIWTARYNSISNLQRGKQSNITQNHIKEANYINSVFVRIKRERYRDEAASVLVIAPLSIMKTSKKQPTLLGDNRVLWCVVVVFEPMGVKENG